jgi:hypothetical protein
VSEGVSGQPNTHFLTGLPCRGCSSLGAGKWRGGCMRCVVGVACWVSHERPRRTDEGGSHSRVKEGKGGCPVGEWLLI